MVYIAPNSNGQKTMANSTPGVIASNQTPVPITGNQSAVSTITWTSASTLNDTLTINTSNLNTVSVTMSNSSSNMSNGVISFEASPDSGTTWFAIALVRVDSNVAETTYPLSTIAERAWTSSIDAFTQFRVRLSTVISGTGSAVIKISAQLFAVEPMLTIGQSVAANLQMNFSVTNISAGGNLIGKVGLAPQSSGTWNNFMLVSAATTNATLVKNFNGALHSLTATNNAASVAYLKLYTKSTAPTVGTDVPVWTFLVPAGGGIMVPIPPIGILFGSGIAYAITGGPTTADTTAVAAGQVIVNGSYV